MSSGRWKEISRSAHFSRRSCEDPAGEAAETAAKSRSRFVDVVGAASACKLLIQAEEAKMAAMASKMQQIEAESAESVTESYASPSEEQLNYEHTVEATNALVEEVNKARAEAAAKFSAHKYWQIEDANAYDPSSDAERVRRMNEYRAFLAEQRDKNLKSMKAGVSPVLARQNSELFKAAAKKAQRAEWRQKERDKVSVLLRELAAVDAEIQRLRSQAC